MEEQKEQKLENLMVLHAVDLKKDQGRVKGCGSV